MQNFGRLLELTVVGFKSIRSIDRLPLGPINLIIGANGAGKSNLISLFRFVPRLVSGELPDYIIKQGGITKILHFGPKITKALEISFRSDLCDFTTTLEPTVDGGLALTHERFLFKNGGVAAQKTEQNDAYAGRTASYKTLEKWRTYHFHDTSDNSPLRASAPLTEPEQLAADGGNLPAFLYYLQERHHIAFNSIVDSVRQVAPFLGELVLRPEALNPNLIRLRWRHIGRDEIFDVSDLSDGTLRFIALAALLLQPAPPSTIVLDEPELGLHPAAITQLAALMHQASPDVQIIAATQSPTFANHFGWQDFIVADRDDESSRFRRLEEDEVKAWMDDYAMGEIWEKNLIGGRP